MIDDTLRAGDKIGVTKRPRSLLTRFTPHLAAFSTGLAIGTGINRKWLRINLPSTQIANGPQWAPPPTHTYLADYFDKDAYVSGGYVDPAYMPSTATGCAT